MCRLALLAIDRQLLDRQSWRSRRRELAFSVLFFSYLFSGVRKSERGLGWTSRWSARKAQCPLLTPFSPCRAAVLEVNRARVLVLVPWVLMLVLVLALVLMMERLVRQHVRQDQGRQCTCASTSSRSKAHLFAGTCAWAACPYPCPCLGSCPCPARSSQRVRQRCPHCAVSCLSACNGAVFVCQG